MERSVTKAILRNVVPKQTFSPTLAYLRSSIPADCFGQKEKSASEFMAGFNGGFTLAQYNITFYTH